MSRITFSAAERADIEVDLWGTVFKRVPLTRVRKRAFTEAQARLTALESASEQAAAALSPLDDGYVTAAADLEENTEAAAVEILASMFDVILAPVAEGDSSLPSALIVERYEQEDLTLDDLEAFIDRLAEAAGPPTSPSTNSES